MIAADSYRALHQDLVRAGCFRAPTVRSWAKFGLSLAVAAAFALPVYAASSPWALLLLVPSALFLSTAILLGHEAAHGAACAKGWQNDLLVFVSFGILSGVATTFWKPKHNVVHHASPNVPGVDRDLKLGPIALDGASHRRANSAGRWLHRNVQAALVWPLTLLLAPLMRVRSLVVLGRAAVAGGIDRAWALDAAALALHYALWLVVPAVWVGFGWALAIYVALFAGVGLVLSFIFLLGHTGLPLVSHFDDPWSLQVLTSRTVRLSPLGRWFWVGLDTQLAHHLFPKMSHFHAARADAPIREWCLAHGLTPVEQSVWAATADVARHFVTSWRDEPVDARTAGWDGR
jgi:fatty acid desaturase